MPHIVGRIMAKCPSCGCDRFQEVPVGPLYVGRKGDQVVIEWGPTGKGYLCAAIECGRPYQISDAFPPEPPPPEKRIVEP